MHIDFCLLASDLNDNYFGLYPIIKNAWLKLGIETKLILISNYIPEILIKYSNDIILFEPIPNIHTAFIAQVIRLLYPCLFEKKNVIISDMDIIPLNKKYYLDNIEKISDDKIIIYRDAYIDNKMYSMCYVLANSDLWRKTFYIRNVYDIKKKLIKWYSKDYNGQKNCTGWFTDQKKLFKYLNKFSSDKIVVLKDKDTGFKRLDKRQKKFILENLNCIYDNVKNKQYTDFHVIRPYYKYLHIINKIVDLI